MRNRAADRAAARGGSGGGLLSVEQSWESLRFFQQNSMGRMEAGSPGGPASPRVEEDDSGEWGRFGGGSDEDASPLRGEPEPAAAAEGEEVSCVVPTLPTGRTLVLDILSTHGDVYYVGLTGIEVFDESGAPLRFGAADLSANPPDVNVLPGYGRDPRTVDKLVDGTNRTTDDLHMWLAPFTQGQHHTVTLDLGAVRTISLIRIWNYNKSRIHAQRGAQDATIELDGVRVFAGALGKATGLTDGAEDAAESILFTTDEPTIARLEAVLAQQREEAEEKERAELNCFGSAGPLESAPAQPLHAQPLRPMEAESGGSALGDVTAGFAFTGGGASDRPTTYGGAGDGDGGLGEMPERPMTSAGFRSEVAGAATAEQGYEAPLHPRGMEFELQLLTTWGDRCAPPALHPLGPCKSG